MHCNAHKKLQILIPEAIAFIGNVHSVKSTK